MKIAVFSDIHGPTLSIASATLLAMPRIRTEVIARVREARIPTVMGHYDDGTGFERSGMF